MITFLRLAFFSNTSRKEYEESFDLYSDSYVYHFVGSVLIKEKAAFSNETPSRNQFPYEKFVVIFQFRSRDTNQCSDWFSFDGH